MIVKEETMFALDDNFMLRVSSRKGPLASRPRLLRTLAQAVRHPHRFPRTGPEGTPHGLPRTVGVWQSCRHRAHPRVRTDEMPRSSRVPAVSPVSEKTEPRRRNCLASIPNVSRNPPQRSQGVSTGSRNLVDRKPRCTVVPQPRILIVPEQKSAFGGSPSAELPSLRLRAGPLCSTTWPSPSPRSDQQPGETSAGGPGQSLVESCWLARSFPKA